MKVVCLSLPSLFWSKLTSSSCNHYSASCLRLKVFDICLWPIWLTWTCHFLWRLLIVAILKFPLLWYDCDKGKRYAKKWWVRQGLNLWPLPCRGSGPVFVSQTQPTNQRSFFLPNRFVIYIYTSVVTPLWQEFLN